MENLAVDATIYEQEGFLTLDIGARMRDGHIDVAEGDSYIVERVTQRLVSTRQRATVLDIGSGSGVLTQMLAERLPEHRIVANDVAKANVAHARERLENVRNAEVWERPFEEWSEPTDIFVSWGTHHHLGHGYLERIKRLMKPGGCLIIGDEFCPEYLSKEELSRGRAVLVDGYLFTSEQEEQQYRASGQIPDSVQKREDDRRIALWNWYRYVIDEAVLRKHWDVAVLELQIARDDLTTRFADEHKTSPLLLETELRHGGFRVLSKHCVGSRPASLQSFVIYEAVV